MCWPKTKKKNVSIKQNKQIFLGEKTIIYDASIILTYHTHYIFTVPIDIIDKFVCKKYKVGNITNEVSILSKLQQCDQIIKLIGYSTFHNTILINKCQMDLFTWKHKYKTTVPVFWKIATQLLLAVQYCHFHNIVHADIKLENIGVYTDRYNNIINIVLLDFEHAIELNKPYYKATHLFGSTHYIAPETLVYSKISKSTAPCIDYWQVGVVLYVLLESKYPSINYQLEWSDDVPIKCKDLISKLLVYEHVDRLNLDDNDITMWIESNK